MLIKKYTQKINRHNFHKCTIDNFRQNNKMQFGVGFFSLICDLIVACGFLSNLVRQ